MAGQMFVYFFAKPCQLQFDIFLRKINDLPKPGLRLDVHFTTLAADLITASGRTDGGPTNQVVERIEYGRGSVMGRDLASCGYLAAWKMLIGNFRISV